ncbi:RyR domain-containing protein [Paraburkholderia tropica]|uniref:RyR domain-containing protein n=1 Tax=Paraburkholderia tropica TaxID=92647 RepID=UPI0032B53897
MHVTQVARIAHEVDRAYLAQTGDSSVPAWDKAAASARQAAALTVTAIARGNVTPEATHEAFVAEYARNGWVYGETLDHEAKTHPQLVPYEALPIEVKTRDALIVAVVRGALGVNEDEGEEG